MVQNEYYTIGEFLQLHESATSEFNPKFGNGAERNSKANEKAVKDILNNAQELDKKAWKEKKERKPEIEFEDYNKTTMDVNFEYEPSKEWKERVKKLATVGTESDRADYYDTEGNEKFYNARKKNAKDRADRNEKERQKGIVGRNNTDHKAKDYSDKNAFVNEVALNTPISPKVNGANSIQQFTHDPADPGQEGDISMSDGISDKTQNQRKTVAESFKPLKRLKFKNTVFLSESQVLAKVPEDYRVNENKFYMQDKTGTDYLVECKSDPFGYVHMEITNKLNKQSINEELNKIKRLADYNYKDDNVKIDKSQISGMSESINNLRKLLNE
jgi:hypothetical protein